ETPPAGGVSPTGDAVKDPKAGLPDELVAVLSRALASDPDDRYDSALKFADAVRWATSDRA
ncbi:hypothetical protein, partial [Halorussus sp. GCM10023401]